MLQTTMVNDRSLSTLTDEALVAEVKRLASHERQATVQLIRALAEIDARQLYLGEGCPSLFAYCTQVLHLGEGSAYNRIEAARACRRFPMILKSLEDGDVTLTGVRLLAPHLTQENLDKTLAAARHRSKREVEILVATLRPLPAAPTIIRKLPTRTTATLPAERLTDSPATSGDAALSLSPSPPVTPAGDRPVSPMTPLAPERFKVQFTVSRNTHDKFRRAQDLLRHAVPNGDPAEIFDRALTLLIQDVERRRLAAATHPRTPREAHPGSRHIPASVCRDVWKRDAGRCAYTGREGRCRETAFLELHHVEPYAMGGEATAANIQLRCRAHNRFESRLFFGEEVGIQLI